ncbi:hypothetical protein EZJ43_15000 [Pedobacter changchengzhani]|uniref:Uncharacterized protein n=1 Tax=Pedobacter changchengzhani TaxID=2529274 RepID=A0A4R5MI37_9SPHI|nr:hypothetical protein [Pedobacter changchengzhani]TDG35204.1 hypothetical protein EZJ43_15000 [Pedobacter changchengzhani]
MSAHDSHAPVQNTKGIWALPLIACIICLILLVIFTRPIFNHEDGSAAHEKTEMMHKDGAEKH